MYVLARYYLITNWNNYRNIHSSSALSMSPELSSPQNFHKLHLNHRHYQPLTLYPQHVSCHPHARSTTYYSMLINTPHTLMLPGVIREPHLPITSRHRSHGLLATEPRYPPFTLVNGLPSFLHRVSYIKTTLSLHRDIIAILKYHIQRIIEVPTQIIDSSKVNTSQTFLVYTPTCTYTTNIQRTQPIILHETTDIS